eukprot:TRINITY_DN37059_c0_g1_i1.p1 TRINITY_DN37059_c0_g1~~TRINITY_DN37059_c0_g1_i1.p1  ORF type:complete len:190 (-),score=45.09 TRINITY_DN37059_c0_g1_i1:44-613(-)
MSGYQPARTDEVMAPSITAEPAYVPGQYHKANGPSATTQKITKGMGSLFATSIFAGKKVNEKLKISETVGKGVTKVKEVDQNLGLSSSVTTAASDVASAVSVAASAGFDAVNEKTRPKYHGIPVGEPMLKPAISDASSQVKDKVSETSMAIKQSSPMVAMRQAVKSVKIETATQLAKKENQSAGSLPAP